MLSSVALVWKNAACLVQCPWAFGVFRMCSSIDVAGELEHPFRLTYDCFQYYSNIGVEVCPQQPNNQQINMSMKEPAMVSFINCPEKRPAKVVGCAWTLLGCQPNCRITFHKPWLTQSGSVPDIRNKMEKRPTFKSTYLPNGRHFAVDFGADFPTRNRW